MLIGNLRSLFTSSKRVAHVSFYDVMYFAFFSIFAVANQQDTHYFELHWGRTERGSVVCQIYMLCW